MVKKILLVAGVIILIIAVWLFVTKEHDVINPIYATGDLDDDGLVEEYILDNHCLIVRENDQIIWQSPKDWSIDSFVLGDADNDKTVNLVISLWKKGSFGQIKPFWFQGEDKSYKNHLFVLKLTDNTFRPLWFSSDLDRPIVSFAIIDVDSESLNELVVEQGKYRKIWGERYALDTKAPLETVIWQWQEWGFGR